MAIEFRALKSFGAEVIGLDPSIPVAPDVQKVLYQAWLEHGVLMFRGTGTSSDVHVQLSRCFGEHDVHYLKSRLVDGYPELFMPEMSGKRETPSYHIQGKLVTGYLFWHQDFVYTPTISKGGMMRMIQMPKTGGETGWIDTCKAYEALPEATRKAIAGLEVMHRFRIDLSGVPFGVDKSIRVATQEEAPYEVGKEFPSFPDVVHPLVSTHPETGRKSLGISPLSLVSIVGMDLRQSNDLLEGLVAHCLREEFMFVHRWKANDLVVWDNRRTIHSALGHPLDQERVVHRTTLKGGFTSGRIMPVA